MGSLAKRLGIKEQVSAVKPIATPLEIQEQVSAVKPIADMSNPIQKELIVGLRIDNITNERIKEIINKNLVDINLSDGGKSILDISTGKQNDEIIKFLIEKGATDSDGNYIYSAELYHFMNKDDTQLIEFLYSIKKLDYHILFSTLTSAIRYNKEKTIKVIIEIPEFQKELKKYLYIIIDTAKNVESLYFFENILQNKDSEIVDEVKKSLFSIDITELNNKEFVKFILNLKNEDITSPEKLYALYKDDVKSLIQTLKDKNIDINLKEKTELGRTMLMIACANENITFVTALLQNGADVNLKDNEGNSALVYCIKKYDDSAILWSNLASSLNKYIYDGGGPKDSQTVYNIVKLLISYKADVNSKNNSGKTPLMFSDDTEITKLLIESGADVNAKDDRNNTFINLIREDDPDMVKLLLSANIDLHNQNKSGETFFGNLIKKRFIKIAKFLKENNIKVPSLELVFFLNEQDKFLSSLSENEKEILTYYTKYGDVILNEVLRNNVKEITPQTAIPTPKKIVGSVSFPLPSTQQTGNLRQGILTNNQSSKEKIIPSPENKKSDFFSYLRQLQLQGSKIGSIIRFVNDFSKVFQKSPVLKEELTVYRGVQRAEDIFTHGNEYLSTSYKKDVAEIFKTQDGCCFITITIKPGVHAVCMESISRYPGEREILIGPPYKVEKTKVSETEYNLVISPLPRYRNGGRKTYRKKSKKSKRTRKVTSYHSFFG